MSSNNQDQGSKASRSGNQEAENVDKIRDILFGSQMRDYDGKFSGLEERLKKSSSELREDVTRQLQSLEAFTKSELGAVVTRIEAEKDARIEAIKALTAELREFSKAEDKRYQKLEAQNDKAHRELREQVLAEANRLAERIRKETTELTELLHRESADLRDNLAHRADLAEMFAQLALHLRGELPAKGKK